MSGMNLKSAAAIYEFEAADEAVFNATFRLNEAQAAERSKAINSSSMLLQRMMLWSKGADPAIKKTPDTLTVEQAEKQLQQAQENLERIKKSFNSIKPKRSVAISPNSN